MRSRTGIFIAVVAAAIWRWWPRPHRPGDEERPAMIIKNGSLVFQSGNHKKNQKGKPWKELSTGVWTPHQPMGRPANRMRLTIVDGENDCSGEPVWVNYVEVRYVGSTDVERFRVTTTTQAGHGPWKIPVVSGSGLSEDNSSDNPTLERSGPPGHFTLVYQSETGQEEGCNVLEAEIEFIR